MYDDDIVVAPAVPDQGVLIFRPHTREAGAEA